MSSWSVPPEPMVTTWSILMEGAGCQVPHPIHGEPPWVLILRRSRWAPPPAPRILRWRLRTEPRSHPLRTALVQASHRERPGLVSRLQSRHGRRSCMSNLVRERTEETAPARVAASHSALVGDLLLVIEMSMDRRSFGEKVPRSDRLRAEPAGPRAWPSAPWRRPRRARTGPRGHRGPRGRSIPGEPGTPPGPLWRRGRPAWPARRRWWSSRRSSGGP